MITNENIKNIVDKIDEAIIISFEKEKEITLINNKKKDLKILNKIIINQKGILLRNKELMSRSFYSEINNSLKNNESLKELLSVNIKKELKSSKNKYEVCQSAALNYIRETELEKSNFADISIDLRINNKESSELLLKYINEAKDIGYYVETINTEDSQFDNPTIFQTKSILMHNGALKHIVNRMKNSGDGYSGSEKIYFLQYDPRIESKFHDFDLNKKIEHYRKESKKSSNSFILSKGSDFLGVSRQIAQNSISATEIKLTDVPDIEFREALTNYFENISVKNKIKSVVSILKISNKKIDLLEIAKADNSKFFKLKEVKKKRRKSLKN